MHLIFIHVCIHLYTTIAMTEKCAIFLLCVTRSQNYNMSLSYETKPRANSTDKPQVLLYASTLRWIDKVKVCTHVLWIFVLLYILNVWNKVYADIAGLIHVYKYISNIILFFTAKFQLCGRQSKTYPFFHGVYCKICRDCRIVHIFQ